MYGSITVVAVRSPSRVIVKKIAIGSLLPLSNSSSEARLFLSLVERIIENTAAASVELIIAPNSNDSSIEKPII